MCSRICTKVQTDTKNYVDAICLAKLEENDSSWVAIARKNKWFESLSGPEVSRLQQAIEKIDWN